MIRDRTYSRLWDRASAAEAEAKAALIKQYERRYGRTARSGRGDRNTS
jgi:hypothetical protein